MCLHAQSLQLHLAPPPGAPNTSTADAGAASASAAAADEAAAAVATQARATEVEQRGKRYWGRQAVRPPEAAGVEAGAGQEVALDVVAPDPFVFSEGELQL